MRRRTLDSHGFFIRPFLKPGLHLLDLGCGPGSMTVELARQVAPTGRVTGIDRHDTQFNLEATRDQSIGLSFQTMDAYQLQFPEASFDGIFSHALLEHLARPVDVLREALRVLKPGGFIGVRSPDWGGFVFHPNNEDMCRAVQTRLDLQTRRGGDVYAGRKLGVWLTQAGFSRVKITGSYEIYEDHSVIVDHIAAQLEENGYSDLSRSWKKWGDQPDALFAQAWFEAVGFKS